MADGTHKNHPLSSSLPGQQYRIRALEATLQILREEQGKLQRRQLTAANEEESPVEKASITNQPETKDSLKHVGFVNWDENEKNGKEKIQAKLEKLRKDMEAAKSAGQKSEMERLRVRMKQLMDSLTC
jgi:hypothetical protein